MLCITGSPARGASSAMRATTGAASTMKGTTWMPSMASNAAFPSRSAASKVRPKRSSRASARRSSGLATEASPGRAARSVSAMRRGRSTTVEPLLRRLVGAQHARPARVGEDEDAPADAGGKGGEALRRRAAAGAGSRRAARRSRGRIPRPSHRRWRPRRYAPPAARRRAAMRPPIRAMTGLRAATRRAMSRKRRGSSRLSM